MNQFLTSTLGEMQWQFPYPIVENVHIAWMKTHMFHYEQLPNQIVRYYK